MSKNKLVLNPNIIQKFKYGGTNLEWEEEARHLANQLETIHTLNNMIENGELDLENKNKDKEPKNKIT